MDESMWIRSKDGRKITHCAYLGTYPYSAKQRSMDVSNPTTHVPVPLRSTGIDGTGSRRPIEETVDSVVSDDGFLIFP